jgi:hypothetical protein
VIDQHLHEVGRQEKQRREFVARPKLELRLIAAREAVVTGVGAPAIRVQRPFERHAPDAVERRLAANFLLTRRVGAPLSLGQSCDAIALDDPGDVSGGEQPRPEVEQHAALFRFCFANSS